MTLRTYIDRAIRDGAAFDAVICGCDVQQTFCWQPDMCITERLRGGVPPAARRGDPHPGRRAGRAVFHHRDLHGQALSRRCLFAVRGGLLQPARVPAAVSRRIRQTVPAPEPRLWGGRFFCCASHSMQATIKQRGCSRGQGPPRIRLCGFSGAMRRTKLLPRGVFRTRKHPQSSGGARGGKARLELDSAVFSGIRRRKPPRSCWLRGDPAVTGTGDAART